MYVVDCCQFGPSWMFELNMELMACADLVGSATEQSCILPHLIWWYQWYETLITCLHYTSDVPHPFLLLIAANLSLAGLLGWKWSLWPVPTWLAVQRSKDVFFLILYDSINDMKLFRNVCIAPQPCHIHLCCWLLSIWLKLNFWAENEAYGLCRLGWRYNGAKLYFYWPCMIASLIWNIYELSALHLRPVTAFCFVVCCQISFSWMIGLEMGLMACADLVGGTTKQSCFPPWPYVIVSMIRNNFELSP